jgi:hypothetical protein
MLRVCVDPKWWLGRSHPSRTRLRGENKCRVLYPGVVFGRCTDKRAELDARVVCSKVIIVHN